MGSGRTYKRKYSNTRGRTNLNNIVEIDQFHNNPKGLPKDDISSGLNTYSGHESKWNDHPKGFITLKQRTRAYREMSQDPTISSILNMYTQLTRMADWSAMAAEPEVWEVEGKDKKGKDWDKEEAKRYQLFLKQNMRDMDGCLEDLVSAAMDFMKHGFAAIVPVYKFRRGPDQTNPKEKSRYDDGAIGWQSFKQIDNYSICEWDLPQGGGYTDIKGFYQETISGYSTYVPKDRYLHFRTSTVNNSPTGESILKGAIRPYYDMKRFSDIEAVGLERNLENIPKIYCPADYLSKRATDDQRKIVQHLKNTGSNLKFNNQTYLLLPGDRDDNGNRYIDVELMGNAGNSRQDMARRIVEAKERLMAEALNGQFLKLGSSSGSFALSSDMTDLFVLALRGYLDSNQETLNEQAVYKLFELNKTMFPEAKYIPKLEYSGLEKEKVGEMINGLKQLVDANLVIPSKEIQGDLLNRLDLPDHEASLEWDTLKEAREKVLEQTLAQNDAAIEEQKQNSNAGQSAPSSGGNAVSDITGG